MSYSQDLRTLARLAPIGLAASLLFLIVTVRVHLEGLTLWHLVVYMIPLLPVISNTTLARLLAFSPAIVFGSIFLLIIHGLSVTSEGPSFDVTQDGLRYIGFLLLLFLSVVPCTSFFGPFEWHCSFSTLGISPRRLSFLFAGRGAILLLKSHVDGVATMAKLQDGGSAHIIRRFAALRRAVIPFFYATVLRLESGLVAHEQRGLMQTSGVVPLTVTVDQLRAWLAATLALGIAIHRWTYE